MKRTFLIYAAIASLVVFLLATACKKSEENNQNTSSGCTLSVIETKNSLDSIFYSNDKIQKIYEYDISYGQNKLSEKVRFEYLSSEIQAFPSYSDYNWVEEEPLVLTYSGNNLVQVIRGNQLHMTLYYDKKLKYILYQDATSTPPLKGDSLSVTYDNSGNNIINLKWYNYDLNTKKYSLLANFDFSLDNSNNPYFNSVYFAQKMADEVDGFMDFFNANNITKNASTGYNPAVGSGVVTRTYSYNNMNYPLYVDDNFDGRTYFTYTNPN